MRKADTVAHLAVLHAGNAGPTGTRWDRIKEINIEATQKIAEIAENSGIERVAFTSTIKAHPEIDSSETKPSGKITDADAFTQYVQSKRYAAALLRENDWSFQVGIVHPTLVFGPYDYRLRRVTPFKSVRVNRVLAPPLYQLGNINPVHIEDVAAILRKILSGDLKGDVVASTENISRRTFYKTIASADDRNCLIAPIPLASKVVPPAIDLANDMGILPVNSNSFTLRSDSGTVPDRFENCGVVNPSPISKIAADALKWYKSIGFL